VQLDPIKPKLKPPGTKRLKLKRDILLSIFAFKFNLRHYIKAVNAWLGPTGTVSPLHTAGAYTRPPFTST
jgi:hypothetical protein